MRAAYVPGHNRVEVGDFPVPTAHQAGDLVVRMLWASICGSDLHHIYHGYLKPEGVNQPGYPGHEGIGVVVESRSDRFAVGDHVLTVPASGRCFAEYQLIDDLHVVALPADGDFPRLLMAQQYGTTLFAMRMFWTAGPARTAAIIGAGSAGLFFLQHVRRLGFEQVVISDLNADRLAVAKSLGADVTVLAPQESLIEATHDVSGGVGADLVIEAAGYDALRADAIAAVRNRGAVGYFGLPESQGLVPFPMHAAYRKAVRIQLASATQAEPGLVAFHDAVEHIRTGLIDVDYCLGNSYSVEQIPAALERARDQGHGAIKLSIKF
ncbi:MAG: zinc-binding dehydrogenase [Propionibacteriaceae bacterium]